MFGVAVLVPGLAVAQIAPGPLTEAHAGSDTATGCFDCHEILGKVTNDKCWGCHDHEALRRAVAEDRGLHADFKNRRCVECHTEHKGRKYNIVDWTTAGGKRRFQHARTGFALTGKHATIDCTDCHKKKFRSGRTSYTGLSRHCESCHEDQHQFTNVALRKQCDECHVAGIPARKLKPRDVPFNHAEQTGIALVGRHSRARCRDCHKYGKMSLENKRTCTACHKNPHGKTFLARPCGDCHHPSRAFARSRFDHAKTGFPLRGGHKRLVCQKCHEDADVKPSRNCDGCHSDPHRARFAPRACADCHATGGMSSRAFDHTAGTGFALDGKHARIKCRSCHRGRRPNEFEKHAGSQCGSCHAHTNAHDGQLAGRACTDCHVGGDVKNLVFDHDVHTKFPLEGFHADLRRRSDCRKCHERRNYRHGKLACAQCHKDSHRGELGDRCHRCHRVDVRWEKIEFAHDQQSSFALVGGHRRVECARCHPKRSYKHGKTACFDCHSKGDRHAGKLGRDCATCHRPEPGAPLFEHSAMTSFPLLGRHRSVECRFCHRPPPADGPELPGWTASAPEGELDLSFPAMGTRCAECHLDRHGGAFGDQCGSCHNNESFSNVRAMVHDTGAFRLAGVHARLPCNTCHVAEAFVDGQGETCQICHWDDDAHNNGLGPYCGDCHGQHDWRPARFSHLETGFALLGRHRFAECEGCHTIGVFQGTPTECDACHMQDALATVDPIHTSELTPCEDCHAEIGFVPARFTHPAWRLVGQHRRVRCRNCHPTGQYAGTLDACVDCHLDSYYTATNPDHVANGHPFTCEDCHTPVSWRPATPPP